MINIFLYNEEYIEYGLGLHIFQLLGRSPARMVKYHKMKKKCKEQDKIFVAFLIEPSDPDKIVANIRKSLTKIKGPKRKYNEIKKNYNYYIDFVKFGPTELIEEQYLMAKSLIEKIEKLLDEYKVNIKESFGLDFFIIYD